MRASGWNWAELYNREGNPLSYVLGDGAKGLRLLDFLPSGSKTWEGGTHIWAATAGAANQGGLGCSWAGT